MKDMSQESVMIRNPSFKDILEFLWTKINGKAPMVKVMMKLITKGATAVSSPSNMAINIDRNMNNALTSSAYPTFLLIALTFILLLV